MGCTGLNSTWGIDGWVSGSRYHTRISNVKLGKFKVAITSLLMTPSRGNTKGIVWIGKEPSSSLESAFRGALVVVSGIGTTDDVAVAIWAAAVVDV